MVVYGSTVTGHNTPRSDVDVAVITHETDPERNRKTWFHLLGKAPRPYDVRVYELLPLPIQVAIADHHKVVFGDPVELSATFYRARRLWKDQKPRYEANRFKSLKERQDALRRARQRTKAR